MHKVEVFEMLLGPSLNDSYVWGLPRSMESFLMQAMNGRKRPFSKGVANFQAVHQE